MFCQLALAFVFIEFVKKRNAVCDITFDRLSIYVESARKRGIRTSRFAFSPVGLVDYERGVSKNELSDDRISVGRSRLDEFFQ